MKLVLPCAAALLACSAPPTTLIVRAGWLWDPVNGLAANRRVTIQQGTIATIADDAAPMPACEEGCRVVDARERFVMPGLIDAHVHLFASGSCTPAVGSSPGQFVRNAREHLRAGVTTVADLAAPLVPAVAMRAYVGVGRSRGPRVMVAGPMLTNPHGYLADFAEGELVQQGLARVLSSPHEARQAVRELAEGGVDLIKVGVQERNYDDTPLQPMPPEVLRAIVEEGHRQDMRVVAHALTVAAYDAALTAGVDAIVHGCLEPLPLATIERVVTSGTIVVPTLGVFDAPLSGPARDGWLESERVQRVLGSAVRADLEDYRAAFARGGDTLPPHFMANISRQRMAEAIRQNADNLWRLQAAGATLAFGTDAANCFQPFGAPAHELALWAAAGVSPQAALRAATAGSAALLGLGDALGRVAVGYRADLIVVDGRPDQRVHELQRVVDVVVDGVVQAPGESTVVPSVGLTAHIVWDYLLR